MPLNSESVRRFRSTPVTAKAHSARALPRARHSTLSTWLPWPQGPPGAQPREITQGPPFQVSLLLPTNLLHRPQGQHFRKQHLVWKSGYKHLSFYYGSHIFIPELRSFHHRRPEIIFTLPLTVSAEGPPLHLSKLPSVALNRFDNWVVLNTSCVMRIKQLDTPTGPKRHESTSFSENCQQVIPNYQILKEQRQHLWLRGTAHPNWARTQRKAPRMTRSRQAWRQSPVSLVTLMKVPHIQITTLHR